MSQQQQQKIVQYLNEAHATERTLVRELQAQIAMTPKGGYRDGLEQHLDETREHSERIEERLGELGQGSSPLQVGVGLVQAVAGQGLALAKAPLNVVRGSGGEEKVLKNAKDACASEALEIATYTSLARLAHLAGDRRTERLAESVLEDEQRMLDRLLSELPQLTDAVTRAEVEDNGSYDVTETGAADAAREVGDTAKRTARKVPGVARAEGTVKGAVASESDLPISRYSSHSANDILQKLPELSQVDLAKVDAYERKNENRSTITSKIDSLQGDEPWPGYDELRVAEIRAALSGSDEQRVRDTRAYERKHKARAGVIDATERELGKSAPSVRSETAASGSSGRRESRGAETSERGAGYSDARSDSGPSSGNGRDTTGHDTSGPTTDDAMTRSEEELRVGKASRESGQARLRKHVVTEQVEQTVPVQREEVRIEREPITDANVGDATAGPSISEEEHEVTLHEEEVVVEKRVVPKERVRLDTDTVTEDQTISEEVRKEQIEAEGDTRGRD